MSVSIRTLAFTRRPSILVQSGRFLVWRLTDQEICCLSCFDECEARWKTALGDVCACSVLASALDPFWAPSKAAAKVSGVLSSLEFDHKHTVAFEKSDLTNRKHGEHCVISWWMNWETGRWKCIEANAHPSLQTPLCFVLSLLKWFGLFGLDTYCKLVLSECICSVSHLGIEIIFAATWKKNSKWDRDKTTVWLPFFLSLI